MFCSEMINKICVERLDEWRTVLVDHDSTPFALVSIGHNNRQGEIHLCVTGDVDISTVINIMEYVISELKKV